LIASEALYKHLSIYDKNSLITVEMKKNDKGGVSWDVEPMQKKELVQVNKPNHDLAIKWGMAFNNATRLVANISDLTPAEKAKHVEKIMPEMFNIAKGLDDVLMQEQKQEDNNDDLPF